MKYCILLIFFLFEFGSVLCQDSSGFSKLSPHTQAEFLKSICVKYDRLGEKISTETARSIKKLNRQNRKVHRKLLKKDSVAAQLFITRSSQVDTTILKKLGTLAEPGSSLKLKEYIPAFDSLRTMLAYLQANTNKSDPVYRRIMESTTSLQRFETRMQVATELKKVLKERSETLITELGKLGLARQLKHLNKEVFYYQQQLKEFKSILNTPAKIERKAVAAVRESKAFQEFMKKNSMLAQLFAVPDGYGSMASLQGLQTRTYVESILAQRIAGGGINPQQHLQAQMRHAESKMTNLKERLKKIGSGGSGDIDMPPNFKPNNQKILSFLERLEYGGDFQTRKLNSYLPVTTDMALTVGYRLNDKSVIGIGASYRLGWGGGIGNIRLTGEGLGLRSFADVRIKGGMWMTGGYEQNYFSRFSTPAQSSGPWRQSALLGITKKLKLTTKKTTKLQLLYDFLHRKNEIHTPALQFRFGYTFN